MTGRHPLGSWSLAGALALALGGCIFVTPPTGARLGDHSQEFANVKAPAPTATTIQFKAYDGGDFLLPFPDFWSLGSENKPAGTNAVTRAVVGGRLPSDAVEGAILTQVTLGSDGSLEGFADSIKKNLSSSYKNFSVIAEDAQTLGGQPAKRLEGRGLDDAGVDTHTLAYSTVHDGKGFVIVLSTIESRFATYRPVYDFMFKNFAFKTASPAPGASTSPASGSSPSPSAAPSAGPSQSPAPSPSAP